MLFFSTWDCMITIFSCHLICWKMEMILKVWLYISYLPFLLHFQCIYVLPYDQTKQQHSVPTRNTNMLSVSSVFEVYGLEHFARPNYRRLRLKVKQNACPKQAGLFKSWTFLGTNDKAVKGGCIRFNLQYQIPDRGLGWKKTKNY